MLPISQSSASLANFVKRTAHVKISNYPGVCLFLSNFGLAVVEMKVGYRFPTGTQKSFSD